MVAESYSQYQVPKDDQRRSTFKAVCGRWPKKPFTDHSEEEIRKLYFDRKLSIRTVMKRTGHSNWQVRKVIGKGRSYSEANKVRSKVDLKVRADILRLRRAGNTYEQIGALVARSVSVVERVIRESLDSDAQVQVKREINKRVNAEKLQWDHALLVELSDQGLSKRAIVTKVGCSADTVARARRKAGWTKK